MRKKECITVQNVQGCRHCTEHCQQLAESTKRKTIFGNRSEDGKLFQCKSRVFFEGVVMTEQQAQKAMELLAKLYAEQMGFENPSIRVERKTKDEA